MVLRLMLLFFICTGCSTGPNSNAQMELLKSGDTMSIRDLLDQHDVVAPELTTKEFVVFSSEKETNNIVRESLIGALNDKKPIAHIVYVADISKMPRIITSLFAMPKMKKYPFSVYLDRDGKTTANWPHQKEKVAIYKIKNSIIQEILFAGTKEELIKILKIN